MTGFDPARASAAQGPRPRYFADPDVDRLWSVTLALAGEVSILRDRLDAHERLSHAAGGFGVAEVDGFEPDDAQSADRAARREAFLKRSLRSIELEMALLESGQAGRALYSEADAN